MCASVLAASLGAVNTHASTPSGLDGPGGSGWSTAHDLAVIFRAAMANPVFAQITAETFEPKPAAPAPAIVPPGFVPDPNYTWVPRTNVRRPEEPDYSITTATTTSPSTNDS